MTLEQIKAEIGKLPLTEKLSLLEETWDTIAASPDLLPLADWQRRELDRRYKEYQEGGIELRDWQTVHESIRDKYQ